MHDSPVPGGAAVPLISPETPTPQPPRRVVLTGFMGAGKTTVGKLLAQRLGWRFQDVDAHIESSTGATIAEIFAEKGEPWFRELEHQAIIELLLADSTVLALGGGAIEQSHTRQLLLASPGTALVHLRASLETVLKRCQGTESIRPVLRDAVHLEKRYHQRLPLYLESHFTIQVDDLAPEEVVSAILKVLSLLE